VFQPDESVWDGTSHVQPLPFRSVFPFVLPRGDCGLVRVPKVVRPRRVDNPYDAGLRCVPLARTEVDPVTTRERVRSMKAAGLSTREIALALSISTQAVNKHLKRLRSDGELPEPQEASA
jgi:hypothetical protein